MGNENPSVTLFREYLRIKTVHPTPDYDSAVVFLRNVAKDVNLEFTCIETATKKPIVVMTWKGSDPDLSSLLLNSHVDVVPVFPEHWKVDPFSAHKDEEGNIYARGSQDMKCVGIQYIEAIRRLKASNFIPTRDVHLSFVPEEEVSGEGMKELIKSPLFKQLNIGYCLDEGLASPDDSYPVYYGERRSWWIKFSCDGNPGHGSQFIKNTAVEKMHKLMGYLLEFRSKEEARLLNDPTLTMGDMTTCNLTIFEGGVQCNVLPSQLSFCADFRLSPHADLVEFEKTVNQWMSSAGEGVSCEYLQRSFSSNLASTSKADPWWRAFSGACDALKLNIETKIFPASTDSRFLREAGVQCLGFSPMNNTPVLLHDHNEYLNEAVFLRGIDVYTEIIPALVQCDSK